MSVHSEIKKVTTETLRKMKFDKEKITILTAYDYTTAKMVDAGGVDAILIGDSAANVMAGHETTLPITLDQMIYHAQCVVRGVDRALVVADLPFGTYQSDPQKALESGVRMMKESGAHAVKIEGGEKIPADLAKKVSESISIPTIGIGAGPDCDGQVLVYHDMVGMNKGFSPKFLRRYLDLYTEITGAVSQYVKDVKDVSFPNKNESY